MENVTIQTRIHPETGEVLRRRRREEIVRFKGLSKTVAIEGWFPDGDGDGVLTEEDVRPIDAALAELKDAHKEFVRNLALKVRTSIGLSQEDASVLLTGSKNSFYKYEHGAAEPSRPTLMLMRLLGKRPELVADLKIVANDETHATA